jgi:hypothetical protein
MANQVLFQGIANFLSESPEWVENWVSTPVKKKPSIDYPDFVVSLFDILPIEHFDRSLKLNRSWYKECRRELENRRNFWVKRYWETVEEYKKAYKDYENCWFNYSFSDPRSQQCSKKYDELVNKKENDFRAWADVDRAILRCGFLDLIDHEDPAYYIKMCNWGLDPYEIPTPGNDPEGILDYWGDEDPDA